MGIPNQNLTDKHGYKLHRSDLYRALGLNPSRHLPIEGLKEQKIGNVTVWVLSKSNAQAMAECNHQPFIHRVLCECPECGAILSAGRLHQHITKHRK